MKRRSFWDRFGASIVLGTLLLLVVGMVVVASATEERVQGESGRGMGERR